jgi:DNA-binding NtrC family response regulator
LEGELCPAALTRSIPDIVLIEHLHDRSRALQTVINVRALCANIPIVLLAWESCEEFAIDALNAGVTRYLKLPCPPTRLHDVLLALNNDQLPSVNPEFRGKSCLIGNSRPMCELRSYIQQVAAADSNVLITGETGTGKELVAQLIQENSGRRDQPYICLNSAAIPEALVESELFGHEKGAFTGALSAQEGKLAAANHGTVFFDEIGDVSPAVQAKLLRAIESRTIYRLGSNRSRDLDIRILAASNQDLETATLQNRFRGDLYYRLNVIRIEVPPLRERLDDLPLLVEHYLTHFSRAFRKRVNGCSNAAMDLFFSYSWPGNIRELRNVMEAAFVTLSDHSDGMLRLTGPLARSLAGSAKLDPGERTMLLQALTATNWNRTEAAKRLQWSRMTLYRKMHRYQVSPSVKLRTRFRTN